MFDNLPNTVAITLSRQVPEDGIVTQLSSLSYVKVAVTVMSSMIAYLKVQLGEFTNLLHHLNESIGVFNMAKPLRDSLRLIIIANFLTVLDRKIESVATQIAEIQTLKKGLLHQM